MGFKRFFAIYFFSLSILFVIGLTIPRWYYSTYGGTSLADLQVTMWQTTFATVALTCGVLGIILGFILNRVDKVYDRISYPLKSVRELAPQFQQLGMEEIAKIMQGLVDITKLSIGKVPSGEKKKDNPLTPEQRRRRDQLLERGRTTGLNKGEADELRKILEDEARDSFTRGAIGFLAFLGLLFLVGLFIASLLED